MSAPGPRRAAIDAALICDTRADAGSLGVREVSRLERRLLFRADTAHVEIRVPPVGPGHEGETWLFGQYVRSLTVEDGAAGRVSEPPRVIVVLTSHDCETSTVATAHGDFALPCDPSAPFALEFRPGDGPRVRVAVDP